MISPKLLSSTWTGGVAAVDADPAWPKATQGAHPASKNMIFQRLIIPPSFVQLSHFEFFLDLSRSTKLEPVNVLRGYFHTQMQDKSTVSLHVVNLMHRI
jgi:hypothetical protein